MLILSLLSKPSLRFYLPLVKKTFYFSNRQGAHVGVAQRCLDVVVAEQFLNELYVRSALVQIGEGTKKIVAPTGSVNKSPSGQPPNCFAVVPTLARGANCEPLCPLATFQSRGVRPVPLRVFRGSRVASCG